MSNIQTYEDNNNNVITLFSFLIYDVDGNRLGSR